MRHVYNQGDLFEVDTFAGIVGTGHHQHAGALRAFVNRGSLGASLGAFAVPLELLTWLIGTRPTKKKGVVCDIRGNSELLQWVPSRISDGVSEQNLWQQRSVPAAFDLDNILVRQAWPAEIVRFSSLCKGEKAEAVSQ